MKVLAIDPGVSGALAVLHGRQLVAVHDMPTREKKGRRRVDADKLAEIIRPLGIEHAFIEDVHSMPKDGHVGAFAFGRSAGIPEGVLAALGIKRTHIAPSVWKTAMKASANKTRSRARATQLFGARAAALWPLAKHDGRAEAAMLGLYGIEKAGFVPVEIEW